MKSYRWQIYLCASLLLLSLTLVTPELSYLVFVALVPFLYFITEYNGKKLLSLIWSFGFVYMLLSTVWMLQVQPESWTALQGASGRANQYAVWLLSSFVFSVGFVLLGFIMARLKRRNVAKEVLLMWIVILWPLGEIVRSVLFSIVSFGPGASIGAYWNFGVLGLSAMSTPLAYASRLVGLYGMTALVVVVNLSFYVLLRKNIRALGALVAVVVITLIGFFGYRQASGPVKTVGVLHLKSDADQADLGTIRLPDNRRLDLFVAPEHVNISISDIQQKIGPFLKSDGTFVASETENEAAPAVIRILYYSPVAGLFELQSKNFLIPTGEYIPYVISGYSRLVGQNKWIKTFNEARSIRKGTRPEQTVLSPGGINLAVLSCSGILAPEQFRRLASQDAQILISPASLHLLSGASFYKKQAMEMARFHAIANAKPFVQAARGDQSFILDHNGRQILQTSGDTRLVSTQIQLSDRKTPYTLFGELTFYASTLTLTVISFRKKLFRA